MKYNKMRKIIPILLIVFVMFSFVYAANVSIYDEPLSSWVGSTGTDKVDKVNTIAGKVWDTFKVVIQVATFSGIILAGLRYMFSAADVRADIKSGLLKLVLGLSIVFGASILVDIIVKVTSELL